MISMDTIVRSLLLKRGYPMHWYLAFLKYGADCLRELTYNTLKTVETEIIVADAGGAIAYPTGYTAWIRLGVVNGQHIRPLLQGRGTFNRLQNTDADDVVIPYDDPTLTGYSLSTWLGFGGKFNEYGEYLGGDYGAGIGYETDVFEDIPERNQIQLSQELAGCSIIMDFVGDGSASTNLTRVSPMAQAAIEQYIIWQMKEHGRHYSKSEAKDEERMWLDRWRELRARMNPVTKQDIIRIFRRGYYGALKN